jgi:urease beta subunit
MSTSTKALLIAALAILLLFGIGHYFGFSTQSKEPRTHVMELDTAAVVRIHFEDRQEARNDFILVRESMDWQRRTTDGLVQRDAPLANELLQRFQLLKVKRDMGMIRLLGERYDLTDSTLARITFTHADGHTDALHLGSNTFAPGKVGAWTYVNVPGEREVYGVEGLLMPPLLHGRLDRE